MDGRIMLNALASTVILIMVVAGVLTTVFIIFLVFKSALE